MRGAVCLLLSFGIAAGQTPTPHVNAPAGAWRQTLLSLPARPPANTTAQDVYRFEQNLRLAAPYFTSLTPGDYEANRELVRRMAVYLAGLRLIAHDPEMRRAVDGASRTFYSMGIAAPLLASSAPAGGDAPPPAQGPAPQSAPAPPPFSLAAPDLGDVPPADKDVAKELSARYTTSAARGAAAWQNAETIRLNLAARGFTLNIETATALARMPLEFNSAADDLRSHEWDDARRDLQRAEYEADKITKTVGR